MKRPPQTAAILPELPCRSIGLSLPPQKRIGEGEQMVALQITLRNQPAIGLVGRTRILSRHVAQRFSPGMYLTQYGSGSERHFRISVGPVFRFGGREE